MLSFVWASKEFPHVFLLPGLDEVDGILFVNSIDHGLPQVFMLDHVVNLGWDEVGFAKSFTIS